MHCKLFKLAASSPEALLCGRYGGVDLWVWNTGKSLLQRPMPPFIFGRSRYDNWLTHELSQVTPKASAQNQC